MRILLLGEYSNVHATLADGLRRLGHEVTVISDGDRHFGYQRDISLARRGTGIRAAAGYVARLLLTLPKMRGYDIVQLINPDCIALKAERQFAFYRYLRRHNKAIVLGSYGNDWQWVEGSKNRRLFRYGDFNVADQPREHAYARQMAAEWTGTPKGALSRYIADDCDGIITCLYEYHACYQSDYPDKTRFIPLPVRRRQPERVIAGRKALYPVRLFLGIKREVMEHKGTDIFHDALQRLSQAFPGKCVITEVEDLPFAEYMRRMEQHDVILDQAYSYTPAMNALQAMDAGLVCVGGGEPENYEIIGETELRPIINVLPDRDDVYQQLEQLLLHPERLPLLQRQSIAYVARHHDHVKVARQYADFYQQILAISRKTPER